jgi:hypothetical protein
MFFVRGLQTLCMRIFESTLRYAPQKKEKGPRRHANKIIRGYSRAFADQFFFFGGAKENMFSGENRYVPAKTRLSQKPLGVVSVFAERTRNRFLYRTMEGGGYANSAFACAASPGYWGVEKRR